MVGRLAYALPALAASFLFSPAGGVIQGVYGTKFGVPLKDIALVMLVSRVVDALADPTIGYLSDRIYAKIGDRRPSVVFGCVWFVLAAGLLWAPLLKSSTSYFLIASVLYFIGWSLFDIPHTAWGAEIEGRSEARARLYAWRTAALYLGSVLFSALPLIVIQGTAGLSGPTLLIGLAIGATLMAVSLPFMWRFASAATTTYKRPDARLTAYASALIQNRPFLWLMLTYLFAGFSFGGWVAMQYLFASSYLGLAAQIGWILLSSAIVGFLAIPVWARVAQLGDRKRAWAASVGVAAILMVASAFVTPGRGALVAITGISCCMFFCFAAQNIFLPTAMADVIDFGRLKFGQDRAATYFAFFTMITKANAALGAAAGFLVAGAFGFSPTRGHNDAAAVFGLKLAFSGLPAASAIVAFGLILANRFDRRRQALVQTRLRQLEARATAGVAALHAGAHDS